MNDVYRVPAAGGTPMPVSEDRYVNEFGAAPSPDGRAVALVARGNASGQWWRNGSSHLDQSELWLRAIDGDGTDAYTQLTPRDAKQEWPMCPRNPVHQGWWAVVGVHGRHRRRRTGNRLDH
jgi:hypothetical protein